jgi:hypothetical protein
MPRASPVEYRRIAYVESTGDTVISLITIDHDTLGEPLRFARNSTAVVHSGETYEPFDFDIKIPQITGDGTFTQTKLIIDTVDQRMVTALRSVTTPLSIEHKFVLLSDSDAITHGPFLYEVRGEQTYDAQRMELVLTFQPVLEEQCPWKRLSPSRAPGLY